MQIQCRLAYHLALLRNRSLGEEEEEEEEGVVVGQMGDGKRGGGNSLRYCISGAILSIHPVHPFSSPRVWESPPEHPASIPMDIDPGAGTGFPHDDDDDVK